MTSPLPDTAPRAVCPASNNMIRFTRNPADDAAVQEILTRGNFPLLVGETILAEVATAELTDGLQATASLSAAELARLSADLADNISQALTAHCDGCDVAEIAADAAALFVVCLRRSNMVDVDNLPTCSVSFNDETNDAQLMLTG